MAALTKKEIKEKQARRLELQNIILDAQLEMAQIQTDLQKDTNVKSKVLLDDEITKL